MTTIDTELLGMVTGGKAAPTTSHVGTTRTGTSGSTDSLLGALTGLQKSLTGLNSNSNGFGDNNMFMLLFMMAFMGGHNTYVNYGGGGGYPVYAGGWGGCGGWGGYGYHGGWGW